MRCSRWKWRVGLCGLVSTVAAASWLTLPQLSAAPGASGQSARTPSNDEELKRLVVMLQGTLAEQSFNGAGIVFGQGSDRLYIATANHVVRQASQQADRVQVQFRWLPGEPKEAKILGDADIELDLAVLAVSPARDLSIPELPWAALSDPEALKAGQKLFPIGFPAGSPWDRPQQPHLFHSVTVQRLQSEGAFVAGHSGGALVTEDLGIVGIASSAGSLRAESARIDRVVERLKTWGYPVDLRPRPPTTPPDLGSKTADPPPSGPKPPSTRSGTCALSGLVFDRESNRPLSAVSIGLDWRPPQARPETLVRNVATSGPDGRFSFECPPGIAADRYPLYLLLSHPDWTAINHTNVDIQLGQTRTQVNVPISVSIAPRRDIPPAGDDCMAIDPTTLKVEYHDGRGGWHLVANRRGIGQVMLPDFDDNEAGARAVERIVRLYGVTEYCQIGRPPAAFYFLVRGVPTRDPAPGERCQRFDPSSLAVVEPGSTARGRGWAIGERGRIILTVPDGQVARSALEIIRRHGFSSVCYPARPMTYLR
jgi:Trypsin-like peptidase domain